MELQSFPSCLHSRFWVPFLQTVHEKRLWVTCVDIHSYVHVLNDLWTTIMNMFIFWTICERHSWPCSYVQKSAKYAQEHAHILIKTCERSWPHLCVKDFMSVSHEHAPIMRVWWVRQDLVLTDFWMRSHLLSPFSSKGSHNPQLQCLHHSCKALFWTRYLLSSN